MMFIFRLLIGIALIALLLPLGRNPEGQETGTVDPLAALTAAGAAFEDVRAFCDRQPQACAVGAGALQAMGEHARAGARSIQDLIAEGSPEEGRKGQAAALTSPGKQEEPATRSLPDLIRKIADPGAAPAASRLRSQQTLQAGDLVPAWRRPESKGDPG